MDKGITSHMFLCGRLSPFLMKRKENYMSDDELDLVESVILLKTLTFIFHVYADEVHGIDLDIRNGLALIDYQVDKLQSILDNLYSQS